MSNTAAANAPRHYMIMTVAIFLGIAGVFLRFFDNPNLIGKSDVIIFSWIPNILMVIAVVIALKSVFGILEDKSTR